MKNQIENLQTLRAIAAFLVILDHSLGNYSHWWEWDGGEIYANALGRLGVAIFFVISGFIMMHSHHDEFGNKNAIGSFFAKRAIRIIPLYWIFTLVSWAKLNTQYGGVDISNVFNSFFFIPYLNDAGFWRPIHQVGWTLNFEIYFYLAFGLSLFFKFKYGIITIFSIIIFPILLSEFVGLDIFYNNYIVLYFLVGILLFIAKEQLNIKFKIDGYIFLIISIVLILIGFVFIKSIEINILLIAASLPFIAVNIKDKTKIPSLLINSGNSSYSVYLIHTLVIGLMFQVIQKITHLPSLSGLIIYIFLSVIFSFFVGFICYRFLEKPLLNFGRNNFLSLNRVRA